MQLINNYFPLHIHLMWKHLALHIEIKKNRKKPYKTKKNHRVGLKKRFFNPGYGVSILMPSLRHRNLDVDRGHPASVTLIAYGTSILMRMAFASTLSLSAPTAPPFLRAQRSDLDFYWPETILGSRWICVPSLVPICPAIWLNIRNIQTCRQT